MSVTEEQGKMILDHMANSEKHGQICEDIGVSDQDYNVWVESHRNEILEAEQYCRILREDNISPEDHFWVRLIGPRGDKMVKGWSNGQPILFEEKKR